MPEGLGDHPEGIGSRRGRARVATDPCPPDELFGHRLVRHVEGPGQDYWRWIRDWPGRAGGDRRGTSRRPRAAVNRRPGGEGGREGSWARASWVVCPRYTRLLLR